MSARSRLDRDSAVELVGRLESLATGRPVLAGRLERLGWFLSGLPDTGAQFPLRDAATAVNPDDPKPVAAFREFRRTVAKFAAEHSVDVALVVDGQKRV